MKKVYCGQCTKYDNWEGDCSVTYIVDTHYGKVERYHDCRIKNSNNQCTDYEEYKVEPLLKKFTLFMNKLFFGEKFETK